MDKDRIYGHTELAMLYFKNIQPKSASTQLARWIRRDEELWEELLLAGYRKGQKIFTPLQTTILVDHLGDPECQITTASGKAFLLFDFPDPTRERLFTSTYTDKQ